MNRYFNQVTHHAPATSSRGGGTIRASVRSLGPTMCVFEGVGESCLGPHPGMPWGLCPRLLCLTCLAVAGKHGGMPSYSAHPREVRHTHCQMRTGWWRGWVSRMGQDVRRRQVGACRGTYLEN